MHKIMPKVKSLIKEYCLDLEVLDEATGHNRVMNDLGSYFDFWTTGTVMTVHGSSLKDGNTENNILGQIEKLIKMSDDADHRKKNNGS